MKLLKNCLAAALPAAAATFVPASAQTHVEGVVQPPVSTTPPVVHAVPLNPPASAPEATQATQVTQKSAEKPVHKPVHRRVYAHTYPAAPSRMVQTAPPMLPERTTLQAAEQPAPTPRPYVQAYAQPAPAPQPYVQQPAPVPQPYAQPAPAPQPYAQPAAQPGAQPVVNWTLQVIRDGQQVDSFDGATTVGQARTNKHDKVITHKVGCRDQPAGSIDLQRTITVSPLRADPAGSVLAIDAQETVESDTTPRTREGCKLPPQPSQVHANHPGLVVPAGQWVNWQIVSQDPSLQYRVRASLAAPTAQP
jgi:hypothetical protein